MVMRNTFLVIIYAVIVPALLKGVDSGSTSDGAYVWATTAKDLTGWKECALVIQATTGPWKKIFTGNPVPPFPTADNRRLVFGLNGSTILLTLGTNQQVSIPNTMPVRPQSPSAAQSFVLLQKTGSEKGLMLHDLASGADRLLSGAGNYTFAPNGTAFVQLTTEKKAGHSLNFVQWGALPDGTIQTIWTSGGDDIVPEGFTFDPDGKQLAFTVRDGSAGRHPVEIWYYKTGQEKAERLVSDDSPGIESGLVVGRSRLKFSAKGTQLFFKLRERELPKPDPKLTKVTVWSYLDARPQSMQERDVVPRWFLATVSPQDRRVVRLEQANEVVPNYYSTDLTDDYVLLCHFEGDVISYEYMPADKTDDLSDRPDGPAVGHWGTLAEFNWNPATKVSVYLVSTRDNSRILLKKAGLATDIYWPWYLFSPDGRYVLYYDDEHKNYYSYEIASKRFVPLTESADAEWETGRGTLARLDEVTRPEFRPVWLDNGTGVVVRDRYTDLWRLDLTGRQSPVSLTHGFARRNHLIFDFTKENATLKSTDPLVLEAAVDKNLGVLRNSGYYAVASDNPAEPTPLISVGSGYHWDSPGGAFFPVCVLYRESATEPPTPYFTSDFKNYTLLDDERVDKRKGIRKELISWTTFDGRACQGVLEEPPDFDPAKSYPVVIYYYEALADRIWDEFESIEQSSFFLKDGYLLFQPDIHYTQGRTGKSAYDCVVSGAEQLMKLPFVDAKRMGIMGTSFGGLETNYLVTHSSLFAAAAEGAGKSNFVSAYGTEPKDDVGTSYQEYIELSQDRIGGTPWSNREGYLENSPIFNADKVTSPLLIYHSRNDHTVPFAQGMELFMALRRLGKPVWLLDYNEGHGGPTPTADLSSDFSVRLKQFFDHYLKGAPAPVWMTRGIPARLRGVDSGLELDTSAH
jgi:dipeptidyl aminopeptidase/acylaminoacyl peptidase